MNGRNLQRSGVSKMHLEGCRSQQWNVKLSFSRVLSLFMPPIASASLCGHLRSNLRGLGYYRICASVLLAQCDHRDHCHLLNAHVASYPLVSAFWDHHRKAYGRGFRRSADGRVLTFISSIRDALGRRVAKR